MDALKEKLIKAAKKIYEKDLVEEGEGNLSVRIPDKKEMFITPTYNSYQGLRKEDIVRIKFDGEKIEGERDPSSEYLLHSEVYEKRARVNCLIHTHSIYASVLSVLRVKIPVIFEEMLIFLGGSIEVSEYGQANTRELADNALEAMGRKNAVLMSNHGVLACSRNLEDGVKIASLVEKMARIQWGTMQKGPVNKIPKDSRDFFLQKFEEDFSTY